MSYNFTDEATPNLSTTVDPVGGSVSLTDGDVQVDLITDAFSGGSVSVSISPPRGWSLSSITWINGGSGTFGLPDPGVETSHPFTYTVTQNGTTLSSTGAFKIKRQSGQGG